MYLLKQIFLSVLLHPRDIQMPAIPLQNVNEPLVHLFLCRSLLCVSCKLLGVFSSLCVTCSILNAELQIFLYIISSIWSPAKLSLVGFHDAGSQIDFSHAFQADGPASCICRATECLWVMKLHEKPFKRIFNVLLCHYHCTCILWVHKTPSKVSMTSRTFLTRGHIDCCQLKVVQFSPLQGQVVWTILPVINYCSEKTIAKMIAYEVDKFIQ